jgi:hypothetical protein
MQEKGLRASAVQGDVLLRFAGNARLRLSPALVSENWLNIHCLRFL